MRVKSVGLERIGVHFRIKPVGFVHRLDGGSEESRGGNTESKGGIFLGRN